MTINVQALRKQLGLSQQQFADRLHVNMRTVVRWEMGPSKPRGIAHDALLSLQQSLQGTGAWPGLFRIGVCAEFADTLLPVIADSTGMLARRLGKPVQFVPIPWDGRALTALQSGFIDGVLFNEHCARNYAHATAACLEFVGESFVSGAPYVTFSLPSSVPRTDLLSVLWHPQTIKIVPRADMDVTMRLVRQAFRRSSGELQTLAAKDDEAGWFRCSAGLGARLFLNPPAFWGNAPIAYIGGQDQRALIELAKEQTTGRTIVVLAEPAKNLDVELPDSLRTNRLIGIGRPAKMLHDVADAISETRRIVSVNETVRSGALTEIIRWRNLHGSAEEAEFGDSRLELEATLPKTRTYSAELGRWF